jgi:transposase
MKQVAVTIRGERIFVVLMMRAPASRFALEYPQTNRVLGVDPGLRTAITAASPTGDFLIKVNPPSRRDRHFLKLSRRLGRKLDRQRRANNPDCYREDGAALRGRRAKNISNNMRRTLGRLTEVNRHLSDARRDGYHKAAHEFLHSHDAIGVGTWRPPRKKNEESTAQIRGVRRKGLDNAISEFFNILTDKAARSITPKRVIDVAEPGTTKTCPDCDAETGPSGIQRLRVLKWICSECGTIHDRDFAAARSIARRCEDATGSAPGVALPKGRKQRQRDRQMRSQTKARLTFGSRCKVPVADEPADREIPILNSQTILCESRSDVPMPGVSPGSAANEFDTISAAVADVSSEPLADVSTACSARGAYD